MADNNTKERSFSKEDAAFLERASQMFLDTGLTQRDLADALGDAASTSKVNKIINKVGDFGILVSRRFFAKFPGYSVQWLYYGEGEMRADLKPEALAENHERRLAELEKVVFKKKNKKTT